MASVTSTSGGKIPVDSTETAETQVSTASTRLQPTGGSSISVPRPRNTKPQPQYHPLEYERMLGMGEEGRQRPS